MKQTIMETYSTRKMKSALWKTSNARTKQRVLCSYAYINKTITTQHSVIILGKSDTYLVILGHEPRSDSWEKVEGKGKVDVRGALSGRVLGSLTGDITMIATVVLMGGNYAFMAPLMTSQ